MGKEVRLNKFLSNCGVASRRASEEYILQGRVQVNGKVVTDLSAKVSPDDLVTLDGEKIRSERKVYFLMNKPRGVITSTNDEKHRKTVVDLVKSNFKIFPVGRLDYNTTGVLLLTNDGDFSNYITHPKNKILRTYVAAIDKPLEKFHREKLLRGIIIDRRRGKFLEISYPKRNNYKIVRVTTNEGRNHFVKKMFSAVGYNVVNLHRESFGSLRVDSLNEGSYKRMSFQELKKAFEIN